MNNIRFEDIVDFIKEQFPNEGFIPLHAPKFAGNEKKYLMETIDSTFVSSVGPFVNKFEEMMCELTGASFAVAVVNGTSSLHMALILADVTVNDEVISQSLTFIATCNAISYLGATPVFVDVDLDTMGMSPQALSDFLNENAEIGADGYTYNKKTGKRIKACVPMHTFGLPCRIESLSDICAKWNITLVEDSAESLGSYYKGKHTGRFGITGTFSFNGNKTITCGGGGAIITDNKELAERAKHLTTQAKVPHPWAFVHDSVGYNYRMPNLNAALACAQLEQLPLFLRNKRELAQSYKDFFKDSKVKFVDEIEDAQANFWLNALIFENSGDQEEFLKYSNQNGVMSRPVWELMHRLPMFRDFQCGDLKNSEWLAQRVINVPSSVRI